MRSSPLTDPTHDPSDRSPSQNPSTRDDSTRGSDPIGSDTTSVEPTDAVPPVDDSVGDRVRELETQLRYTLADLDNVRKRYARELERERAVERQRAGRLWLPVLDHLDLALSNLDGDASVVAGVESIRAAALDVMAQLGYPRFDDIGHPFDPARHEAISTIAAPGAAGTIVAAARPGYGGDVVLRPASVIVAAEAPDG
jgi:molecular chaperone GrpE